MRKLVKNAWAKGLKEEYKLGKGYLKQSTAVDGEYKFSVLGVLEDIHMNNEDYPDPKEEYAGHLSSWQQFAYEGEGIKHWHTGDKKHRLSIKAKHWAELPSRDPELTMTLIDGSPIKSPISELNDYYDFTFEDYAKAIEEQL